MTLVNEREDMKEVRCAHFDAEVASVGVVSEEEVTGNGRMTTELEQSHDIILKYRKLAFMESTNGERCQSTHVLTVDVTADCRTR